MPNRTYYPHTAVPARMLWDAPDDGELIETWQGSRCGMCGPTRGRLVLDHDHDTGLIRGMLCSSCNMMESCSDHPAFAAWRAGDNPAGRLGVKEIYLSPFTGLPVLRRPPLNDAELAAAAAHVETISRLAGEL